MADDRNKEEVIAGLLKRKTAWPAVSPADACPDVSILAAYFDRSLTPAEVEQWENHFSLCSRCQEQIAILARTEAAAEPVPKAKTTALSWLFDWRFLAPVGAAAAVLLVVVMLQQSMMRKAVPAETRETLAKLQERQQPQPAPVTGNAAEPTRTPASSALEAGSKDQEALKDRPIASAKRLDKVEGEKAGARKQPLATAVAQSAKTTPMGEVSRDELARRVGQQQKTVEGVVTVAAARSEAAPPAPANVAPAAEDHAKTQQQVVVAQAPAQANEPSSTGARPAPVQMPSAAEKKEGAAQVAEANKVLQTEAAELKSAEPVEKSKQAPADTTLALGRTAAMRPSFAAGDNRFVVRTPNRKILWRIGPLGSIERSEDSGKKWTLQSSPSRNDLLAGSAPSATVCWLAGRNGVLLRTTDGLSWQVMPAPTAADIIAIKARDANDARITTAEGRIYETKDSGRTWTPR